MCLNKIVCLNRQFFSQKFLSSSINNLFGPKWGTLLLSNSSVKGGSQSQGMKQPSGSSNTQNLGFWLFLQLGQRPSEPEKVYTENMPLLLHPLAKPSTTQH